MGKTKGKSNNGLMTEGNITRKLLNFAVPMFMANIFTMLYSTVDAIIVGRFVGDTGLAAIGVTTQIIYLAVSLGIGLLMGISTVVSEYFGGNDLEKLRATEAVAVYMVFITYGLKLIVGLFFARPILMLTNTPAEVLNQAVLYLRIVFIGGLPTYGYSMCTYVLRACGDSKRPLQLLAFSCVLNIILDYTLIKVLQMGVAGAAIGTVIAETFAVVFCLLYMKRKTPELWLSKQDFRNINKTLVKYIMSLSLPSAVQMSSVVICTIMVQAVINEYGTTVVAGYTAATRIEQIVMMVVSAFTSALNIFVAQNRGHQNYARIKDGIGISLRWICIIGVATTVIMLAFGKFLLGMFSDDASLIAAGWTYLSITCWFYIIQGLGQGFSQTMRGMADGRAPLIIAAMQIISNLGAIIVMEPLLGITGIWWSVVVSWSLCLIVMLIRYRKICILGMKRVQWSCHSKR